MLHVPGWRIDRLLQIHAHCGVANKKSKRPLILLVAARSAKSHIRLAIAQGHSGRQGRVGTHAGTKTAWNALVQPGHLQTRIDGKRSEEHTSELKSLMRISYAVFCLKK